MMPSRSLTIVERALLHCGQDYEAVLPPQSGYRNSSYPVQLPGSQTANLILYKREPDILVRIRNANHISDYLAARGLPTRRTLRPIIRLQSGNLITFACLYNYLPGHTIPWEVYTIGHVKLLGLAMSKMHAELSKSKSRAALPRVVTGNQHLAERIFTYLGRPDVQTAAAGKLGLRLSVNPNIYQTVLSLCADLPDHQPLHLDFVRGNILFGPAAEHPETTLTLNSLAITGIIDFEKTAFGPRIFDIARTLAFLMVDCKTKTPAQVVKYFLHSGYNKRGSMSFEPPIVNFHGRRLDLLQHLINFYLLHDLYKFLRHNPYESLPQNKHFVRTKNLLAQRSTFLVK
jgi:Ser/Thr protein kinase RdoA (MazF antagonist)